MLQSVRDVARQLAHRAEDVCRHYLPSGRREGRYWLVGDVNNSPGRSLFVRLRGPASGKGAAGKWSDGANGQHGDLLDLIAAREGFATLRDTLEEARRFLGSSRLQSDLTVSPAPQGSPESARRLFAMSKPIAGTIAETYLRSRGITTVPDGRVMRFHPRCFYRGGRDDPPDVRDAWPAMIAAVTDLSGTITGVHRTWLDPSGYAKATVSTPRRSIGLISGSGARFGCPSDVLAAGEGVETMLSLRSVISLPVIAAGSASHLASLVLPAGLRRLYVAQDNDPAGERASSSLIARAESTGVETLRLRPESGDFNDDLQAFGAEALRASLRVQLAPEDVERFWREHAI